MKSLLSIFSCVIVLSACTSYDRPPSVGDVSDEEYFIKTFGYNKDCEKGSKVSCYLAGDHYKVHGMYDKAKYYYEKGCNFRGAENCFALGSLYTKRTNHKKAKIYYEKGCDLKDKGSCFALGNMYYFAQGVEKNIKLSKRYYSLSCLYDFLPACKNYQDLEDYGHLVP